MQPGNGATPRHHLNLKWCGIFWSKDVKGDDGIPNLAASAPSCAQGSSEEFWYLAACYVWFSSRLSSIFDMMRVLLMTLRLRETRFVPIHFILSTCIQSFWKKRRFWTGSYTQERIMLMVLPLCDSRIWTPNMLHIAVSVAEIKQIVELMTWGWMMW